MKYVTCVVLACAGLLTACMPSQIMSPSAFDAVAVGGGIQEVEDVYGAPFETVHLPGGMEEYHYIQRYELPGGGGEQQTYVFTVCQGKIVGKDRRQQRDSFFRFVQ